MFLYVKKRDSLVQDLSTTIEDASKIEFKIMKEDSGENY